MESQGFTSYKSSNINTADRGKLIVMIYDHCLKWCNLALEEFNKEDVEASTKAVFKIQDGITELICSLDMDTGGEISTNLFNLYTFYNRHLTNALQTRDKIPVTEVMDMMGSLRKAWLEAIDKVRVEQRDKLKEKSNNQLRMVG